MNKNLPPSKVYRAIMDSLDDVLILIDNSGNIFDINRAAERYCHWLREDIIGANYYDICVATNHEFLANLLDNISVNDFGNLSHDRVWSLKKFDQANEIDDIKLKLIIGKEINAGLNLEKQNRKIQRYVENISSTMPGNFYWKSKEGKYLGCNAALLKTLGFSSVQDIVGKTDYDLWPEQALELRANDEQVMKSKKLLYLEETVDFPLRGKMYFTVIKMPLLDADGEIVGIMGNSLDITELKNAQAELKIAKERAEQLSNVKSEFIANMSHDVKTPLSGIIGLSEILSQRLTGEDLDFVQDIFISAQQLMTFFENCLEMAKLEESNLKLTKNTFNLKSVVTQIIELFHPAAEIKNLNLEIFYDSNIPKLLLGSKASIYRIILNLIGNAIKFTHKGKISVNLKLEERQDFKITIKLTVRDTGIGIPKDKQQAIFDRFTKIVPSYYSIYEGSGMGLYIVDKFVKAIGGKILVKSAEGEGSIFTAYLPLEIPDQRATEEIFPVPEKSNIKKVVNVKHVEAIISEIPKQYPAEQVPQILLVEDNQIAQKVASSIFYSLHCHIDIANSGQAAMDLFKPGKYHLVLMDIGLTDLPGDIVTKKFREIEQNTPYHVPIIGLTAHIMMAAKENFIQAGMEEIHRKPLSFELAQRILNEYCYFAI